MLRVTGMRTGHHPKIETDDPEVLAELGKKPNGKRQVHFVPWPKAKDIIKKFVKPYEATWQ